MVQKADTGNRKNTGWCRKIQGVPAKKNCSENAMGTGWCRKLIQGIERIQGGAARYYRVY